MNMAEERLRGTPLKEVYNSVELRQKYRENKMAQSKNPKGVFIRCEPHLKHCHLPEAYCMNVFAPDYYEMQYLIGVIRDRLIKNKALLH